MNQRFKWIKEFDKPQFFHHRLQRLYTKKPQIIFINSMSDIADWRPTWFAQVMTAIENNPQNTYLALTKRPSQITEDVFDFKPNNLYIGQTITEQIGHHMIPEEIDPGIDFLSIEPLHGHIGLSNLKCSMVKWVIIGAETGNRKGKVVPEPMWVGDIVLESHANKIPVFMKSSLNLVMPCSMMLNEWPDFILKRHPEKAR